MKIPLIFSKTAIYYAISWYTIPLYIPSIHGPVLVNADGWAQTALLNKINNICPLQNGLVSQEFTVNMKHIETDMINQNRSILKDLPNCFCINFFFHCKLLYIYNYLIYFKKLFEEIQNAVTNWKVKRIYQTSEMDKSF